MEYQTQHNPQPCLTVDDLGTNRRRRVGPGRAANTGAKAPTATATAERAAAAAAQAEAAAAAETAALSSLAPLLELMRAQRADLEAQAAACAALERLCGGGPTRAKAVVREGGVKPLLFALRTHIKSEEVAAAVVSSLRGCAGASAKVRAIMIAANSVPMLCAALKRHDLLPPLQRDGCAALAALVLASADGAKAAAADAHGVEALVGGLMHCGKDADGKLRDAEALAAGRAALKQLVDGAPALLKRVERANGKRFLA